MKINDLKKYDTAQSKIIAAEIILTVIMMVFIAAGLLGGADSMGLINLTKGVSYWVGSIIMAYVIVITATVVHLAVRQSIKKG